MQESMTSATQEWTIDEIIAELDQPYSGKLPEQAIRAAQSRKEEITPRLIELIQSATARIREGEQVRGNGHLIAMYLLTEFRAKEALPAILEAMSLSEEDADELYGDSISEDLPRVFSVLATDTPDVIEGLIADRSANRYVRSAAFRTYLYRVRAGRISRGEAVQRLREHLRTALENKDDEMTAPLVSELTSFVPTEAMEEIQEAFRIGLVNTWYVDERDVEESLAGGEAWYQSELARCRPMEIEDTVEELSKWHSYQPGQHNVDRPYDRELDPFDDEDFGDDGDAWAYSGTIRNTTPKVGRNDPCPCGSGKKFKKCCGAA
jgi:hypothetical protein